MNKRVVNNIIRPLAIMLILLIAILLANKGIPLQVRPALLDYLTTDATSAQAQEDEQNAAILVAYDEGIDTEAACAVAVTGALDQMHLAWRHVTLDSTLPRALDGAAVLLVCSQDLTPTISYAQTLMDWVSGGGRLGLMMMLQNNDAYRVYSHKLGITESSGQYHSYTSLRLVSDEIPLWNNEQVYASDGAITDYALTVRLEDDCNVHIETASEYPVPLLWTHNIGDGRVLINNNALIQKKDSRGFALNAYLLLTDTVVYPIINAGMVFIDDFPAPQPEGTDEALLAEYGYNIKGFFRNHWWPDMKVLALSYGLRYTGVLIETYNDTVTAPFDPDAKEDTLIRYYMSELLQSGGEVGLHGYNHMPLCPDGFEYNGEAYQTWHDTASMAASLTELTRYASKFLTNTAYQTYVPPSNYLSDVGKATLLATLPNIRTVSGVYFPEADTNSLVQEFCEEEDGSISVPRISSGFILTGYNHMMLAQEMMLHGVFSHFIHPDDVLDSDRGAAEGWDAMYDNFSALIEQISQTYPQLRWSTASEGAAAVQRYDRLQLSTTETDAGLSISLSNFYGEAWLALKTPHTVQTVENGECFAIANHFYWIRADSEQINILWEDGT